MTLLGCSVNYLLFETPVNRIGCFSPSSASACCGFLLFWHHKSQKPCCIVLYSVLMAFRPCLHANGIVLSLWIWCAGIVHERHWESRQWMCQSMRHVGVALVGVQTDALWNTDCAFVHLLYIMGNLTLLWDSVTQLIFQ